MIIALKTCESSCPLTSIKQLECPEQLAIVQAWWAKNHLLNSRGLMGSESS